MNFRYPCLAFCLFLVLFPAFLPAQVLTGSIYEGRQKVPLRDAIISVEGTTLSARSNHQGQFWLDHLPVGSLTITVSRDGFVTRAMVVERDRGQDTLSIGLSLFPSPASLDNISQSVAWRLPRLNRETPQGVAALDRFQLRAGPNRHLPDLLTGMPGTFWLTQGYDGVQPSLRGLGGRHIALMQDGMPLLPVSLTDGTSLWWLSVDPTLVQRMEVLRGNGSVAYGNNAAAGVVALSSAPLPFSDGGWQAHGQLGLHAQPQAQLGGHARLSLANGFLAAQVASSRRRVALLPLGHQDENPRPDAYQAEQQQARIGIRLSPTQQLDLSWESASVARDSAQMPVSDDPAGWAEQSVIRTQTMLRWTGYFSSRFWNRVSLTAGQQDFTTNRGLLDPAQNWLEQEQLRSRRANLEVRSSPHWIWQSVSGVELASHLMTARALAPGGEPVAGQEAGLPGQVDQQELGLYSLHTFDILKLHLAMGGRAQMQRLAWSDARFGEAEWAPQLLSGQISAMYPLSQCVEFVSSFGTGFRMPGISDLRAGVPWQGAVLVPSDSLGAERTFHSEIGIKAEHASISGSVMVFHTQLNDWLRRTGSTYMGLSVWQGASVVQLANLDQGFVQGVEAEMEVPFHKTVSLFGSINYTYGFQVTQSDELPGVSPLNSRLGLNWRSAGGLWSRVEWRHASRQTQLSAPDLLRPGQDPAGSPGWNVVHLHVGYDFAWGYATLGIENLMNSPVRYHGSVYGSPGRLVACSLQLGF